MGVSDHSAAFCGRYFTVAESKIVSVGKNIRLHQHGFADAPLDRMASGVDLRRYAFNDGSEDGRFREWQWRSWRRSGQNFFPFELVGAVRGKQGLQLGPHSRQGARVIPL